MRFYFARKINKSDFVRAKWFIRNVVSAGSYRAATGGGQGVRISPSTGYGSNGSTPFRTNSFHSNGAGYMCGYHGDATGLNSVTYWSSVDYYHRLYAGGQTAMMRDDQDAVGLLKTEGLAVAWILSYELMINNYCQNTVTNPFFFDFLTYMNVL